LHGGGAGATHNAGSTEERGYPGARRLVRRGVRVGPTPAWSRL